METINTNFEIILLQIYSAGVWLYVACRCNSIAQNISNCSKFLFTRLSMTVYIEARSVIWYLRLILISRLENYCNSKISILLFCDPVTPLEKSRKFYQSLTQVSYFFGGLHEVMSTCSVWSTHNNKFLCTTVSPFHPHSLLKIPFIRFLLRRCSLA